MNPQKKSASGLGIAVERKTKGSEQDSFCFIDLGKENKRKRKEASFL